MVGTKISLEELCKDCIHDDFDCEAKGLYTGLECFDDCYSCENYEEVSKNE